MLLENKNAIIYGAGGAIGSAVAKEFAREGARVFLAGRTLAKLEALAKDIRDEGGPKRQVGRIWPEDGGSSMRLFDRVYACCYDQFMDRIDRAGAVEHRRRLVGEAGGEVLEIGAGTGKNLPLYWAAERVVALDPDPAMRARANDAAREARVPVEVVEGDAMVLPFPDASFDTVVFSLVLCTVPDIERALAETRRVLRAGGTLRFYEHVRAADPRLARWQDRLERPWGWVGRGCHPNRDTVAEVTRAGFNLLSLEEFDFPAMPPIVRPHVIGLAEPLAA